MVLGDEGHCLCFQHHRVDWLDIGLAGVTPLDPKTNAQGATVLKRTDKLKIMKSKSKNETRLIIAASDHDPDMLYATRLFVPDPFIFLQRNGKRTIVLSDLEIDRARREAEADEIVSFSRI